MCLIPRSTIFWAGHRLAWFVYVVWQILFGLFARAMGQRVGRIIVIRGVAAAKGTFQSCTERHSELLGQVDVCVAKGRSLLQENGSCGGGQCTNFGELL